MMEEKLREQVSEETDVERQEMEMTRFKAVKEAAVAKDGVEMKAKGRSTDSSLSPFYDALPAIMAGAADYFGLGLISPLLPYWLDQMHERQTYVGYIQTAQYFGVILGSMGLGRLSDIYGRKTALIVALAGDVVFFATTGFCPTANLLMANRLVAGTFTPLVITIAWVNDVGEGDQRRTGRMMAMWAVCMSTSFMAGGIVGGALGAENWVYGHGLCSLLALVALVYISSLSNPPRADAGVTPEGVNRVLRSKEFISICCVQFVVGATFTATIIVSTLIAAVKLELHSLETAMVFAAVALFHMLENLLIMPVVLMVYGSALPAMDASVVVSIVFYTLLSFNFAYSSVWCVVPFLVCASSIVPIVMTGNNMIAATYATRYSKNSTGTVLGLARLCFNVGQMIGPVLAVYLYELHVSYFFMAFTAITAMSYVPWRYIHYITSEETTGAKVVPGNDEHDHVLLVAKEKVEMRYQGQ